MQTAMKMKKWVETRHLFLLASQGSNISPIVRSTDTVSRNVTVTGLGFPPIVSRVKFVVGWARGEYDAPARVQIGKFTFQLSGYRGKSNCAAQCVCCNREALCFGSR